MVSKIIVKSAVKAFEKGFNPRNHQDSLKHVTEDISAFITRNPGNINGVLTVQGKPVAQITKEQFQAMANTNLLKTGSGKNTRIIDEYTGTTYYLTPYGQPIARSVDGTVSSPGTNIWDKLLGLFQ